MAGSVRRCVSFHSLRRSATIEPQGRICGERCTASTRLRGACCDAQVGAWHATLGTTKAEGALSARLVLGHSWEGSRACGRVLNTATRRKTMRHDRCHSHYGNATRSTHSATARLTCHGFPTLLQLRVQPHTVTLFVKGTSTHTARCARCATAPTNHHFSLLPTLLVPGGNATVNVLFFFRQRFCSARRHMATSQARGVLAFHRAVPNSLHDAHSAWGRASRSPSPSSIRSQLKAVAEVGHFRMPHSRGGSKSVSGPPRSSGTRRTGAK